MTQPIFLISLPRSGSTLLQRMLAVNSEVGSKPEPWILLPFWAMREHQAGRTVYDHQTCAMAIDDFLASIPDGERSFELATGDFARRLYASAAYGKKYFLDKTPRYFLLIPFLRRVFPDAKFILLTRNPLAVFASLCETFQKGRFVWMDYWVDWLDGHRLLAEAIRDPVPNQYVVKYEDLAATPAAVLIELCRWMELEFTPEMLSGYRDVSLQGRMGDPTGVHRYTEVTAASVEKWQTYLGSAYRRTIARRMVERIAPDDLTTLGYPRGDLLAALQSISLRRGIDLQGRWWGAVNWLAHAADFRYLRARVNAFRKGEKYAYGYYRKA